MANSFNLPVPNQQDGSVYGDESTYVNKPKDEGQTEACVLVLDARYHFQCLMDGLGTKASFITS